MRVRKLKTKIPRDGRERQLGFVQLNGSSYPIFRYGSRNLHHGTPKAAIRHRLSPLRLAVGEAIHDQATVRFSIRLPIPARSRQSCCPLLSPPRLPHGVVNLVELVPRPRYRPSGSQDFGVRVNDGVVARAILPGTGVFSFSNPPSKELARSRYECGPWRVVEFAGCAGIFFGIGRKSFIHRT